MFRDEPSANGQSTSPTPPEQATHLGPELLAYHKHVLNRVMAVETIRNDWYAHLVNYYQIGPDDYITPEGHIIRGSKPSNINAQNLGPYAPSASAPSSPSS